MPQQVKSLLIAFSIFIALFLVVRYLLVPKSFGELGHFRSLSLTENAAKEPEYQGMESCEKCHLAITQEKKASPHKTLQCEACHGPARAHVMYADTTKHQPLADSLVLIKPVERTHCAMCHSKNAGRTKMKNDTINLSMIKQIDIKEHNLYGDDNKTEYKCIECHNPHNP